MSEETTLEGWIRYLEGKARRSGQEDANNEREGITRRKYLAATGAVATAGIAGCGSQAPDASEAGESDSTTSYQTETETSSPTSTATTVTETTEATDTLEPTETGTPTPTSTPTPTRFERIAYETQSDLPTHSTGRQLCYEGEDEVFASYNAATVEEELGSNVTEGLEPLEGTYGLDIDRRNVDEEGSMEYVLQLVGESGEPVDLEKAQVDVLMDIDFERVYAECR